MSERTAKVEGMIREVAAQFVAREANTDPMITITRADVSPDLKRAYVFFTTIPEGKERDALIFLQRSAGDFRHFLKGKASMKRIPHIEFHLDAGERHRQHVDDIFRGINEEQAGK